MISNKDKLKIISIAKKYGVSKILLFGSGAQALTQEHTDIDLAVKGMPPSLFFKFYGELILNLSKPVDLVDLDTDSGFTRMVASEGVPIYG